MKSPVGCSADLDIEHDAVRRRAGQARNPHGLEIVQILKAPFGAIDQRFVVGVAFGNFEFAPDHIAAGTRVAVDFDALDIGSRPLIDHEGDVDAHSRGVARGAGDGLRKGKAEFCEFDRKDLACLVQRTAVEHGAGTRYKQTPKLLTVQSLHVADDIDVAEMIERAFIDGERQRKSVCCGIVFRLGRSDAGVGIALAAIVQPQLLAIGRDAVGIVFIAAGEKTQHIGSGGLDYRGELPLAESPVAHEVDPSHRGLRALRHLIDEVDAIFAAVDDLGYHADIVATGTPVGFHDAADVGLHDRRAAACRAASDSTTAARSLSLSFCCLQMRRGRAPALR